MAKIKKILYPTDFSEHSLCALPYAKELAIHHAAMIHCLHVVDEAFQYWLGAGEAAMPVVMPAEDMKNSAQELMKQFIETHCSEAQDQVASEIVTGRPFVEIIRYARENKMDLIVIATHGHGALASMLLGSVTEKVVRKSTCPVMTVRHPDHKFEIP